MSDSTINCKCEGKILNCPNCGGSGIVGYNSKPKSFEEKVELLLKDIVEVTDEDMDGIQEYRIKVDETYTALLALVREEVEKCGNLNETLEDVNENWKWDDTTHNSNAVRYGINLARLEIKQSLAERFGGGE